MSNTIYCTYLTTYSGDKLPPLYIGSTSVQKIEEVYHGSVKSKKYRKTWESELSNNPHLFETKILTTHSSREEALEEEMRYQIEHDVVSSDLYVNMAIANKKFLFVDYNDPELRTKMKISSKKRWENEEERIKVSKFHKGKIDSEETKKKKSKSHIGKPLSEEHRRKISEGNKRRYESESERIKSSIAQKKRREKEKGRISPPDRYFNISYSSKSIKSSS